MSKPGFRCSLTDLSVLALASLGTIWLWPQSTLIAALIPFAVGHFFLFCNVFRIPRPKELVWAGVALPVYLTGALVWPEVWWAAFAAQAPLTIGLIAHEITLPRYHGIGHAWIRERRRRLSA